MHWNFQEYATVGGPIERARPVKHQGQLSINNFGVSLLPTLA